MHIKSYSIAWDIAVVLENSKLFVANMVDAVVKFVVQWCLIENEPEITIALLGLVGQTS